jgi:hypothetical protein
MRQCEECGDAIPKKRVEAIPAVTLCVGCQAQEEADGNFVQHRMGYTVTTSKGGEDVETVESFLVPGTRVGRG